jgi:hypothetical protein
MTPLLAVLTCTSLGDDADISRTRRVLDHEEMA